MASRGPHGFDAAGAAARALGLSEDEMAGAPLETAARTTWERLDVERRLAIGALVELGGACGAGLLADEVADDLEERGEPAAAARQRAPAIVASCWESGLVARDRGSRTFFMVGELAAALAPHVGASLREALPAVPAPPAAVIDDHLVACAVNLLRHEPLKLTREGTPFRRGLESVAERLGALLPPSREGAKGQATRIDALAGTLRRLGLLRLERDTLQVDADAVEAWAELPDAHRAALLLRQDPQDAARRLLRLVQDLAPDRALPPEWLARRLRRALAAGGDTDPVQAAPRAEHAQRADTAMTALEQAGLLAPAPGGAAEAGTARALTAAGRRFPDAPGLPRPRGLHVGHDLTVLVPRGTPPAVHVRLGDMALLESADQVARYRLDRHAVLEALDRGASAGELELFLAENATPVLPDTVRDDLRRWAERFGEVTSRAGICVACAVPRRHDEFDAVVARSRLSITLVAPGVAVVAPEDHAALYGLLAAAGLTPRRRLLPLPRGPASSVVGGHAVAGSGAEAWRLEVGAEAARVVAEVAALPAWGSIFRDGGERRAAPPPRLVVSQVKDRYRREFGGAQLAALDALDIDELLALEEKGQVRQFLSGRLPAPVASRPAPALEEYVRADMVSVTPARARHVMELAARTGLSCQLAYLQGPGRTQRLTVQPVEIVSDGAGTYVRARVGSGTQERMLATDRIHALRVLSPADGA